MGRRQTRRSSNQKAMLFSEYMSFSCPFTHEVTPYMSFYMSVYILVFVCKAFACCTAETLRLLPLIPLARGTREPAPRLPLS